MSSAVRVSELSFTYRGRERPALRRVSFELIATGSLAVLGRAGAGKSTLLAALAAVVPSVKRGKLSGTVELFGRSLAGRRPADLAGDVAFVFEDFDAALVATTVAAEVAFAPRYFGLAAAEVGARVRRALAAAGLAGLEGRAVATLSGGQKQRLAVAAALAGDARLFLFDEAATDLDPAGKRSLAAIVNELPGRGAAVVTADNDPGGALAAGDVLLLAGGEVVARGEPLAVLADEALCSCAGVAAFPFLSHFERAGATLRPRPGGPRPSLTPPAEAPLSAPAAAGGPPALVAEGLGVTYAGGVKALEDFNFAVAEGDFVAVIGENGGGKTTFAKVAAGLLAPTAGAITIGGVAPRALPPRERAGAVGYLFQNPDHQIFRPTVVAEVAFGPRHLGLDRREVGRRVAGALAAVGLDGREEEDPFAMPKGDRQRVALASVLAMEPGLLLLDEPTTGLDGVEVGALMEVVGALNRRGATVVFITHAMDVVARYARRIAVVAGGRVLAEGLTRRLLTDEALLSRAGLEPPLAARLGRQLGVDAVTPEELTRALGVREGASR